MPTETRYYRDQTAPNLTTTAGASQIVISLGVTTYTMYVGAQVYKVDNGCVETSISGGVVAVVKPTADGEWSATWTLAADCTLAATDKIRVKIYKGLANPPTTLMISFDTEALGATKLNAATWTFYYDFYTEPNCVYHPKHVINCDDASYYTPCTEWTYNGSASDSRIGGFSWSGGTTSINVSDSGSGSDSSGLTASLPLAEAGSGLEVMKLGLPLADAGAGADSFTLTVTVGFSDAGSGADSEALTASVPIGDSGAGSDLEALTAQISGSESGLGTDSLGLTASVGASDSGVGSELFALLASLSMSDSGLGVDSVLWGVLVSAFDSGVGSDSVGLLASLALADVASGTETFNLLATLSILESGVGLDSAYLAALLDALADSGAGVDVVDVAVGALLLQDWGYVLPSKLTRKLGISGTSVETSRAHLDLKVALLDKKKVSMGVSGKPFHQVKCGAHVDISRLGRRLGLGLGGRAVVPGSKRRFGLSACAIAPMNASVKARGRLLRVQQSSILAEGKQRFDLAAEALGLLELSYTYMFVAVTDDKTCQACMQYDGKTFSRDDVDALFPFSSEVDYSLIMPFVHPNCRCMLVLLEVGLGGTFLDSSR